MPETPETKPSPTTLLKSIQVASPCQESWERMPGGDRVRSCARCQHRVYNLSEMTSAEAAELLVQSEGRICVRFYRRADGTILTKDCPVGVQAQRQRFFRGASAAVASVAFACGAANFMTRPRSEQPAFIRAIADLVAPEPTVPEPVQSESPTRFVSLPMQPTFPVTMGTPAPLPAHTIGKVSVRPPSPEKPFLKGLENEMQPDSRPDPFARHKRK